MTIVVVGCGRVGAELALTLCRRATVTVVDQEARAFDQLGPDFEGRTVQGEGFDPVVLRRAGVESAGALAAVTSSDSVNVVAARLARDTFRVPRVVARVYNPRLLPVYQAFGLDTVTSTTWGAQRIAERLLEPPLTTIFSAGNGEVHVVEIRVPPAWAGRPIDQAGIPGRLMAVTHAGRAYLPDGPEPLEAGDRLLVGLTQDDLEALRRQLDAIGKASAEP
ncbi:MAG TPA: TrkA family potassium uptake protein [Anaerolineales bacterium]|nr:TrkA family potassium uptake protein [Anaerolineales bacterium]